MLYTSDNALGATVHDIEGQRTLQEVTAVDTTTGTVTCAHLPLRVNAQDEIDTYTERFAAVHPIFGGGPVPCMFHCYGRIAP